jgi:nucleoside-diphosphate-sugar epimerase
MLTHLNSTPAFPPRVAVFGAKGFVGNALRIALTAEGASVVPIGRPGVDLLDPSCVGPMSKLWAPEDAIVITAALTPDRGRDGSAFLKNLQMADHVASSVANRGCSHLVYFSSDAVYGAGPTVIGEATPAAPADLYGVMHLAREMLFKEVAARLRVPFCILRPCAIYGAGDTHNSYGPNRFIRTALADGRIKIFGAGEETRDHVYIDDVCRVAAMALRCRSTGTLNVASGQTVTFGWLASEIARMAGISIAIEQLPRTGPVTHRSFDTTSMIQSFPAHEPTPISAGLERTIAAVRQLRKASH